jgi:hypothetical protein
LAPSTFSFHQEKGIVEGVEDGLAAGEGHEDGVGEADEHAGNPAGLKSEFFIFCPSLKCLTKKIQIVDIKILLPIIANP